MEDKDSKNKKNMEDWKTINFDYFNLYPHTFRGPNKNFLRKISIRKIWKREFTNTL
jgi:hypothetical protein